MVKEERESAAYRAIDRILLYLACASPSDAHSKISLWFDLAEPRFTKEEAGDLFPSYETDFVFENVPFAALDDEALDVTMLNDGVSVGDPTETEAQCDWVRNETIMWALHRFRRVLWPEIKTRAWDVAAGHYVEVNSALMGADGRYQTTTRILAEGGRT